MKKTAKLLYNKVSAIAEKNIANQFAIAGEIEELVTNVDDETLEVILDDVVERLNSPGWGSYKSAVFGIKLALENVLSQRKSKS